MINVDIAKSPAGRKIRQSFIRKVVQKTIFLSRKKINTFSVSVVFVDRKKIQALNRVYRRKNGPTDILSFNYSSGYNKKGVEGELFLCPEVIKKSAQKNKVSFQKELAFVLSHGVLHILGFRHGRKMYEIQNKILNLKFACG